MTDQLSLRLAPDELWELVQPHLPRFRPRPQGGGTAPLPSVQTKERRLPLLRIADVAPSYSYPLTWISPTAVAMIN